MKNTVVIGPFPPPVHGMSKNLKIFYDDVSKYSKCYLISTSPGFLDKTLKYHLKKILKVALGNLKLFFLLAFKKVDKVYIPPDSGFGCYYTLLFSLICVLFNVKIYFHYRSFLYLNKFTYSMKMLSMITKRNSTHVFLCEKMKDKYSHLYYLPESYFVISNAMHVDPIPLSDIAIKNSECLTIGHLSNLGFGKGLKEVIDICLILKNRNVNFNLKLAGPCENEETKAYLESALIKLGNNVEYIGSVNGIEKEKFYSSLDIFLFPSMYVNEAQPNVIFEAQAKAVPVMAINIGCVSSDVDCSNGVVYASKTEFLNEGVDFILKLQRYPDKLLNLKQKTLHSISQKVTSSRDEYSKLLSLFR